MKIGFIGTGTMGQPMLANLVKKGFEVVAFDVVPAALEAAIALGAARAGSVGEAAANCDLVITMLPSSANVEAVYLGSGGIVESASQGRLCVPAPRSVLPLGSRRAACGFSTRRSRVGSAAPPLARSRSW
jgi:3-hydroxyisobutyrate dehydrogenase-like beta-hydroxyacid dehydrogenase